VELRLEFADGVGAVRADPEQIQQVILNVALNARDAMPGGGRFTISGANETLERDLVSRLGAVPSGRYVRLSLSDTGHGMGEQVMSRLFEPFFTTKQRGEGTGLGLAVVYGLVRQNAGYVHVESAPGQGTSFSIYLPQADAAPERAREGPRGVRRGSETLLVVEDEDGVRSLLKAVLSGLGYTVIAASGGEEALQAAAAHAGPVRLLLTDVLMPGMTGPEVAKGMREARPGIKVLYMSGYAGDVLEKHGVGSDALVLSKPFTVEEVSLRVREALES
jgi:CheY-like chemotaxis protein